MNIPITRTAQLLIDPKSMIFGVAVFDLILVWLRSPEGLFHKNVFMAILLLVSSIFLLLNSTSSNLVAAILSGYLPIAVLWEFWMFARHAEFPLFSYRHFSHFFSNARIEGGVALFLGLTLMILARAVLAIMRSRSGRMSDETGTTV